jgi:hypothetical protein
MYQLLRGESDFSSGSLDHNSDPVGQHFLMSAFDP